MQHRAQYIYKTDQEPCMHPTDRPAASMYDARLGPRAVCVFFILILLSLGERGNSINTHNRRVHVHRSPYSVFAFCFSAYICMHDGGWPRAQQSAHRSRFVLRCTAQTVLYIYIRQRLEHGRIWFSESGECAAVCLWGGIFTAGLRASADGDCFMGCGHCFRRWDWENKMCFPLINKIVRAKAVENVKKKKQKDCLWFFLIFARKSRFYYHLRNGIPNLNRQF